MKKIFVAGAFCALCALPAAAAENYELGVIVGEPTGISAALPLKDGGAVAAAVAWSFSGEDKLNLQADRLWYKNDVFVPKEGRLPLYYGLGGRIKLEDKSLVGVRFPVGLQYYFKDVRFTIFAEAAPILDLMPDTDVNFGAAVGFRLVF